MIEKFFFFEKEIFFIKLLLAGSKEIRNEMNPSVYEYYHKEKENGESFYDVIFFDSSSPLSWEEIQNITPDFPRGWFELCQLQLKDRIDFIQEYWKSVLPYVPHIDKFLSSFFSLVEDIAVFLTKREKEDLYEVELVYSMKSDYFFRAKAPCNEEDISLLNNQFNNALPKDFLSFLRIHNGFAKKNDTGIIPIESIPAAYRHLVEEEAFSEKPITCKGKPIQPSSLIPFYQCYGRNVYQCFYIDWYPSSEMGNVNYSGSDHTISDYHYLNHLTEQMAFVSFIDWFMFYLEEIEV